MKEIVVDYLPWLLSVITVVQVMMAGNKYKNAWLVSLGNQALWLLWIITSGIYGLLLMNVTLSFVSIRNHLLWRRRPKEVSTLRKALEDLVTLKEYRDWHGKTSEYLEKKPLVWQQARDALDSGGS